MNIDLLNQAVVKKHDFRFLLFWVKFTWQCVSAHGFGFLLSHVSKLQLLQFEPYPHG